MTGTDPGQPGGHVRLLRLPGRLPAHRALAPPGRPPGPGPGGPRRLPDGPGDAAPAPRLPQLVAPLPVLGLRFLPVRNRLSRGHERRRGHRLPHDGHAARAPGRLRPGAHRRPAAEAPLGPPLGGGRPRGGHAVRQRSPRAMAAQPWRGSEPGDPARRGGSRRASPCPAGSLPARSLQGPNPHLRQRIGSPPPGIRRGRRLQVRAGGRHPLPEEPQGLPGEGAPLVLGLRQGRLPPQRAGLVPRGPRALPPRALRPWQPHGPGLQRPRLRLPGRAPGQPRFHLRERGRELPQRQLGRRHRQGERRARLDAVEAPGGLAPLEHPARAPLRGARGSRPHRPHRPFPRGRGRGHRSGLQPPRPLARGRHPGLPLRLRDPGRHRHRAHRRPVRDLGCPHPAAGRGLPHPPGQP